MKNLLKDKFGDSHFDFLDWTSMDRYRCIEQGWIIYHQEIYPPEKLEFVKKQALEGDELCIKALTLIIQRKLNGH